MILYLDTGFLEQLAKYWLDRSMSEKKSDKNEEAELLPNFDNFVDTEMLERYKTALTTFSFNKIQEVIG